MYKGQGTMYKGTRYNVQRNTTSDIKEYSE